MPLFSSDHFLEVSCEIIYVFLLYLQPDYLEFLVGNLL